MVEVTEADKAAAKPIAIYVAIGELSQEYLVKAFATHRQQAAKAERDRLRFGSPPEPVANPSASWCDEYARWYYQERQHVD